MAAQLIWIVAVYAVAVLLVHVLHNREKTRQYPRAGKWIHYVLITRNHESVIEWYIRALTIHAFLTGKRLRVTCMDDHSSDGTMLLISKLAHSGCSMDMEFGYVGEYSIEQCKPKTERGIVIDLRLPERLVPLTFMHDLGSRGYGSERGE